MKRSDWRAAAIYYEFMGDREDLPRWGDLSPEDKAGWYRVQSFIDLPADPFLTIGGES